MNLGKNLWTLTISVSFGLAMLLLGHSSFSQGGLGVPVEEEQHPTDYVPEVGQRGSLNATPTPVNHDITRNDHTELGQEEREDHVKTLYDKDGNVEKEEASAFKTEHRGRITFGKRAEHFVVKDSKPAKIQKTRDGSSDATESTGVFKDSLLDIASSDSLSLDVETKAAAQPRPSASPKAKPSASPNATPRPLSQESSSFDLSLGLTGSSSEESSPAPSPKE